MHSFDGIGIIKNNLEYDDNKLDSFSAGIQSLIDKGLWDKQSLLSLFFELLPEFDHKETGKYLDGKM